MKRIIGLDIGPNSVGYAVRVIADDGTSHIEKAGSRSIPTDAAMLSNFDKGNSVSQTTQRTKMRSARRLRQRHLLRRERLHRILEILGFLPPHYAQDIIFRHDAHPDKHYGQFVAEKEPKLAWAKNEQGQFEFLFQTSFEEMLADFKVNKPELFATKTDGKPLLIPYDWTIYYLRKKALTQQISAQELAWILLNFNQKRGYYQLRGEDDDEEQEGKTVEYLALKVVDVEATDQIQGKEKWYNIRLENGWIYRRTSPQPFDWVGTIQEFIVTTKIEKDGTPKLKKDGEVDRSLRIPKDDDWMLVKKKTENDISKTGKTVGAYIYDSLRDTPSQKITGKLVRVVERKFYKDELKQIIDTQAKFYAQFQDKELLQQCIEELYPNNKERNRVLINKGLAYLLLEDILFYQRPLKKPLVGNCQYEQYEYTDRETDQTYIKPVKVTPKSNPLFQEFRLWQFVSNLRIYRQTDQGDVDVTKEFIPDSSEIFDWLNHKKEINQQGLLSWKEFGIKKNDMGQYRWNYVVDRKFPCNETESLIVSQLKKQGLSANKVDRAALWHILYSIEDPKELEKALAKFARRSNLDQEKFVQALKRCKLFARNYAAYSEKAIKKLLALMRHGKHWSEEAIDEATKCRIGKIINGEFDDHIDDLTRARCCQLTDISKFQGLPLFLACYVVYGRHSEAKWSSPEAIDTYLRSLRQHSLNNPIVEQALTEALRTVRDIWRQSGPIDEVHIELGREMKKSAADRKKQTAQMAKNESVNLHIRKLLQEFADPLYGIDNVRPYSPSQQEILKIYEEEALQRGISSEEDNKMKEDIEETLRKFSESDSRKQPSKSELIQYKLWLEQHYCSPYTGEMIPLGKLFTPAYEIEHIIPQSRFFDDSLSNKVICESEVNKLKGQQLGMEFIKEHPGAKVTLTGGRVVTVFGVEAYKNFVSNHYAQNKVKMQKLLLTEIPEKFTNRQLNDTRHITKLLKGLMSNIVREEGENEATSKNVIVCSGGVTNSLKKEWGLNDVWNDLVYPRFERMNSLTGSHCFGFWENKEGKRVFQTAIPIEHSQGFTKKRIDHRHHALDAIVIACTTRNHVNYLNNIHANDSLRYDLRKTLCFKSKSDVSGNYTWRFHKPWETFTEQVRETLQQMIVGFKQNLRIINKTSNYTQYYNEERTKELKPQTKGDHWAIRKSMHKDTVFGRVNLRSMKEVRLSEAVANWERIVDKPLKREIQKLLLSGNDPKDILKILKARDLTKVSVYYFSDDKESTQLGATRKSVDHSFDVKKITAVTDSGIRKILLAHLSRYHGDPAIAFSPDGIAHMNRDIVMLNDGVPRHPIYKVRVCEALGSKFALGTSGNKSTKYVEAADGTNLFFAIYENSESKRSYQTIQLNMAIERQKQGLHPAPEMNDAGDKLLYTLSPNDLVYVPTAEQLGQRISTEEMDKERVYKMVSCCKGYCSFIPHRVSKSIVDKAEFSSLNKMERAISGEMIKEICIPIRLDRLGNIIKR